VRVNVPAPAFVKAAVVVCPIAVEIVRLVPELEILIVFDVLPCKAFASNPVSRCCCTSVPERATTTLTDKNPACAQRTTAATIGKRISLKDASLDHDRAAETIAAVIDDQSSTPGFPKFYAARRTNCPG
jgi:hypothetical protein